ncbi:PREDICTED: (-)-isopiperitenone reductase-like isoform X2 [Nicotiana attenuata]|uniref:(-)-isopiperitenone reductase-like isoform X2 n=1 Tax=Nicotiana attenuata TaxID=49451 RepID=UPI000905D665|nr:PREDICTED: (-)-isopiperitenone reductase-like isoform X2 [Nicotiana attenuata]
MAEESINNHETRKYAVVTGGNKGIGYEICRQLMKKGVMVVLTARDEKRGKEAVEKLMREGSLDQNLVVFHQVDVVDPASVSSLVDFIKSKYGKLDILVNNAGINGLMIEGDVTILPELIERDAARALSITTELVSNEWAIKALSDGEGLTTEKVDEVLNKFLVDFKEGLLEEKGWPTDMAAYKLSKAALNAYTRIVAQKYSSICVNCICPGYTKTDITCNTGPLTPEEATESPVILALLPEGGPSGQFFFRKNVLATF